MKKKIVTLSNSRCTKCPLFTGERGWLRLVSLQIVQLRICNRLVVPINIARRKDKRSGQIINGKSNPTSIYSTKFTVNLEQFAKKPNCVYLDEVRTNIFVVSVSIAIIYNVQNLKKKKKKTPSPEHLISSSMKPPKWQVARADPLYSTSPPHESTDWVWAPWPQEQCDPLPAEMTWGLCGAAILEPLSKTGETQHTV